MGEGAVDAKLSRHTEAPNARVEIHRIVQQWIEAAHLDVGQRKPPDGVIGCEGRGEQRVGPGREGVSAVAIIGLGKGREQRLWQHTQPTFGGYWRRPPALLGEADKARARTILWKSQI